MTLSCKFTGALALALACFAVPAAHAAGSYYNLGAGITASGSSADGSVVGAYVSGGSYYMWTAEGGLQSIGGKMQGGVATVSADGSLISGSAYGKGKLVQAAVYNVDSGRWKRYGGIGGVSDTSVSSAWGLSGDGSTVVGLGWVDGGTAHAIKSSGRTMVDLGSSGGSSRANGTNYDGSVVVGWSEQSDGFWQGAYWKDGALNLMFDNDGNVLGEAGAVSADGTWVIGQGGAVGETWRYNTLTGSTEYLGDYNAFNTVQGATGISADGSIIVGYDRAFGPPTLGAGTIWIEGEGLMNLTDYVTDAGVDLNGRTLALPLGVSADGHTFFGLDNTGSGFVVSISAVPEPGTWALMGLGLAGVAASASRRRKAAAA